MAENISVPTKTPLVGLEMNADTATYVGVLEGTIAALVINECKYRALLELFTDESWEATRIDVNGRALMDLAVDALVRQTGMDRVRAKVLVSKRWNKYNEEAPAVVPKAVSVTQLTESSTQSDAVATGLTSKEALKISDRLQEWKQRQNESAARVSEEELAKAQEAEQLSFEENESKIT